MILLTIINTTAIIFILLKMKAIDISIVKVGTFWENTLLGYNIWFWKKHIRIPIRNRKKVETREDVQRMLKIPNRNKHNRVQQLTAKFSWLKTWKEAKQFEKYYSIVDKETVSGLVSNFKPKQ